MRIMIVDDEYLIKKQLHDSIVKIMDDCEIDITADNGREALNLIETFRPDVVFSDIKMPEVDGLEFSRLAKERHPELVIVLVSAFADFTFAQSAIKYGVFKYLLKPLEMDKLEETLIEIGKELHTAPGSTLVNLTKGQYRICLVNAGNLCLCDSIDDKKMVFSPYLLGRDIVSPLFSDHVFSSFIILDTQYPNMWSVIYTLSDDIPISDQEAIIRKHFGDLDTGLHLSLVFSSMMIEYNMLNVTTQRLQNLLEKQYVFSEPMTLILERDESFGDESLVRNAIRRGSRSISGEGGNVSERLAEIFMLLMKKRVPQIHIYSALCSWLEDLKEKSKVTVNHSLRRQISRFENIFCTSSSADAVLSELRILWDMFDLTPDRGDEDIYRKLVEYVDRNFTSISGLNDITDVFFFNESYLSRLFKKITNQNIISYVTDKKIELAKTLFRADPSLSVAAVGERIGYLDGQYFSRVFKNRTGMNPTEYRQKCRND